MCGSISACFNDYPLLLCYSQCPKHRSPLKRLQKIAQYFTKGWVFADAPNKTTLAESNCKTRLSRQFSHRHICHVQFSNLAFEALRALSHASSLQCSANAQLPDLKVAESAPDLSGHFWKKLGPRTDLPTSSIHLLHASFHFRHLALKPCLQTSLCGILRNTAEMKTFSPKAGNQAPSTMVTSSVIIMPSPCQRGIKI